MSSSSSNRSRQLSREEVRKAYGKFVQLCWIAQYPLGERLDEFDPYLISRIHVPEHPNAQEAEIPDLKVLKYTDEPGKGFKKFLCLFDDEVSEAVYSDAGLRQFITSRLFFLSLLPYEMTLRFVEGLTKDKFEEDEILGFYNTLKYSEDKKMNLIRIIAGKCKCLFTDTSMEERKAITDLFPVTLNVREISSGDSHLAGACRYYREHGSENVLEDALKSSGKARIVHLTEEEFSGLINDPTGTVIFLKRMLEREPTSGSNIELIAKRLLFEKKNDPDYIFPVEFVAKLAAIAPSSPFVRSLQGDVRVEVLPYAFDANSVFRNLTDPDSGRILKEKKEEYEERIKAYLSVFPYEEILAATARDSRIAEFFPNTLSDIARRGDLLEQCGPHTAEQICRTCTLPSIKMKRLVLERLAMCHNRELVYNMASLIEYPYDDIEVKVKRGK